MTPDFAATLRQSHLALGLILDLYEQNKLTNDELERLKAATAEKDE